jgi:hypothetical protein
MYKLGGKKMSGNFCDKDHDCLACVDHCSRVTLIAGTPDYGYGVQRIVVVPRVSRDVTSFDEQDVLDETSDCEMSSLEI